MINEQICSRGLIPQTRRNIWCIIRLIIPAAAERSHAAAAEHEHIFILHLFFFLLFFLFWGCCLSFSHTAPPLPSLLKRAEISWVQMFFFFFPLSLLLQSHFESNLVKGDSTINSSPVMFSPPTRRKWSLFSSFSAFLRSHRPRCADGTANYL